MPSPATVQLLVDETQEAPSSVDKVWNGDPRLPGNRRRRSGGCATLCALACVMFVLGLAIGAAVYTYLTPGAFSELLNLDLLSDDEGDSDNDSSFEELLNEQCPTFPWDEVRLPDDVVPENYNLTLHPNITTGTLSGLVAIDLQVENETSVIVLHAQRLNLSSFYINVNRKKVNAEHIECGFLQQWAFILEEPLEEGDEVVLGIEFEGLVLADMHGLYKSTHHSSNGETHVSLATQFEPTYARKVFPCFDEPNMKATFQLSVIRDPHYTTRSNMNLRISREYDEDERLYVDIYERSVRMSSYLLALAVLENYDYVKRVTRNTKQPIEVRLYAPKDVLRGQSEFGLDVAIKALEFFEDYFNISYPLEKVDLLALDDFAEGAMENWGLITFRDSALLFNEETSSVLSKEHIALVICHEVAHQWFGNLVTMDWWNDIWLNEGFANYMEYKCVDHIEPEWHVMTRFYTENVGLSMDSDGLSSSRAITSEKNTNTTSIMALFDSISYQKSAAIIHMLQGLTGEWYFQKALIEYLNKYAYDNAKGEQLWNIVEKHATLPHGVTVNSLAKAYTTQVGYPVVYISLVNNDEEILVHNQTRFRFDLDDDNDDDDNNDEDDSKEGKNDDDDEDNDDDEDEDEDDDPEWPIPIHILTQNDNKSQLKWLRPGEQKVHWRLDEPSRWVIGNTGGMGYFKVLYDKKIYRELVKQLQKDHQVISAVDRTMIMTDAFDFTRVGRIDIGTYMDLLQYVEDERDKMAWSVIHVQMRSIETLIEETDFVHLFRDFQRSLVVKIYDDVGWEVDGDESPTESGLQHEVLSLACHLGLSDCTRKAVQRFQQWAVAKKKVSPELRGIVFEEGVKHGDSATWEKVYNAFLNPSTTFERQQLISALAATKDPKLINRLLRMTLDGNAIRANAVPRVMIALAENELARSAAWRFFKINYDEYSELLGEGSNLLLSCIRGLVVKLSTKHDLEEVKEFLADKKLSGNEVKLQQLYESVEVNIQWRKLNEKKLEEYLREWDERRRRLHRKRKNAH